MDTITKVVDILMAKWEEQQLNNPYEQHGLLYCSLMSFPLQDADKDGYPIAIGSSIVTHYN